jgi:ribosomal protein L37AE/L43A
MTSKTPTPKKSGDTTRACPECESAQLARTPGGYQGPEPDAPWRCRACGAAIEEPAETDAQDWTPSTPLARELYEAEASDLEVEQ